MLWNIETDVVRVFNPATFHTQSDSPRINDDPAINVPLPELADASLSEQLGLSVELLGRHPVSHFWDPGEPRLLAVEFTAPGGSVQEGRMKGRKGDQLAWMGRRGKYPQVGYRIDYVVLCSIGIILRVLSRKWQVFMLHGCFECTNTLHKWPVASISSLPARLFCIHSIHTRANFSNQMSGNGNILATESYKEAVHKF